MKTFLFTLLVVLVAAVVAVAPAPAQAQGWHPSPAAPYGPGGYYGFQTGTGQIHEWLDLVERGGTMVPKAVAAIVLTEKIWESRSPRPPVQPAVYYPPPPAAPLAQPATGRLVVIGGVTPGELFLNGESKGQVTPRQVVAFDLPVGQHSVIMKTDKKVLVKTASVSPSVSVVINFDP